MIAQPGHSNVNFTVEETEALQEYLTGVTYRMAFNDGAEAMRAALIHAAKNSLGLLSVEQIKAETLPPSANRTDGENDAQSR